MTAKLYSNYLPICRITLSKQIPFTVFHNHNTGGWARGEPGRKKTEPKLI